MEMKTSMDFGDCCRRHKEHTEISRHFAEVPQKLHVEEVYNVPSHAVKIRQDVHGWCRSPAKVWK